MTDYVDAKFVNLLCNRFPRFQIKHRSPLKVNFRCPICGDSKKSEKKARGWILENERDSSIFYHCFNCGSSHSFSNFLKMQDQNLYNEYVAEKFLDQNTQPNHKQETEETKELEFKSNPLTKIKKISQLRHDHPAKKYIDDRKIPTKHHYRIYYAPKFKTWINSIIPEKFVDTKRDEPRLILPFFDENRNVLGVSARGFDPNGLRYITIMFHDVPKIFGLDLVNFSEPYFVVEGAIDSFFLSNVVAMAGADGNMHGIQNPENATFVFDAEPRNLEITKRLEKLIRKGMKVCVWPHGMPGKDINEMILAGLTSKEIENTIEENTFQGLQAELKLAEWRKT